ncbi:MAG: MerC domain-containing protein [Pseudomonadota bacterium]
MNSTLFNNRVDMTAAGLSTACLIHCLALPIIGAAVPVVTVWAEIEWVHKALVLIAAPISIFTVLNRSAVRGGAVFAFAALTGLALLFAGAFVEGLHDYEQLVTALGGFTLGGAHTVWWFRHRSRTATATIKD